MYFIVLLFAFCVPIRGRDTQTVMYDSLWIRDRLFFAGGDPKSDVDRIVCQCDNIDERRQDALGTRFGSDEGKKE